MQIYADVIGQPMQVAGSPQAPALGVGGVGCRYRGGKAGGYDRWSDAQRHMTTIKEAVHADPAARAVYDELYAIYRELHDTFGGVVRARADLASVMKRLLVIRDRSAKARQ